MNIINGNLQSHVGLRQTSLALYTGIPMIWGKVTAIQCKLKMRSSINLSNLPLYSKILMKVLIIIIKFKTRYYDKSNWLFSF